MAAAMGVDVSLSRGLDVVVLTDARKVAFGPCKVRPVDLTSTIEALRPDVIAVDGPPGWATSGRSRPIERDLMRRGISIYATPSDPGGRAFYLWMEESIKAFRAAATAGYPVYRGERSARRFAIEVFPHASAVAIRGCLPPPATTKLAFRRGALEKAGVAIAAFKTPDQVDAALAAHTGLRFLEGESCDVGESGDAVLVLPVPRLPLRYAR